MVVVIGAAAGVIVALVAIGTASVQVHKSIWQRGYKAGRSEAYQEAERAAQAHVAAEVQALRKLLDER